MAKQFDNFWRPAYESSSAFIWLAGSITVFIVGKVSSDGFRFLAALAIPMLAIAAWRLYQSIQLWKRQAKLVTHDQLFMSLDEVIKKHDTANDSIWLGEGFDWEPKHTQQIESWTVLNKGDYDPPNWFKSLYLKSFCTPPADVHGLPLFHGVGTYDTKPNDIYLSRQVARGHIGIPGTTGAGKGVCMSVQVVGSITLGHAVYIIDPKYDERMRDIAFATCLRLGKPHAFHYFCPMDPENSVRLDLLSNYTDASQLATRIAELVKGTGEGEVFKAFAHSACHGIINALKATGQRPTLIKIRRYLELGTDNLLLSLAEQLFDANRELCAGWRAMVDQYERNISQQQRKPDNIRAAAHAEYYKRHVAPKRPDPVLDTIIRQFEHNKDHFRKTIASLLPVLEVLTSGELRSLLSPDLDDPFDDRKVVNLAEIVAKGEVLYMALPSLADSMAGSAIGSFILSDMVGVVATQYYYNQDRLRPVDAYCDEATEIINEAAIRMANKSRGADFSMTFAFQTNNDVIVRMANEAGAKMLLGNLNTTLALRTLDDDTALFLEAKFLLTKTGSLEDSASISTTSTDEHQDWAGGHTTRLAYTETPKVRAPWFALLPNAESFAALGDGRHVKLRTPLITVPDELKYDPRKYSFTVRLSMESPSHSNASLNDAIESTIRYVAPDSSVSTA